MKFSHLSDCHLGSWNAHPDLRELPLKAFEQTISKNIAEKVDFILIAGDLFDTSMPSVDVIRFAAEQLRRCKENGIDVYVVAGSHDFSPTGKTMLSVLESAGLIVNVNQRLINNDDVQIFGIEGLRGGLDKNIFERYEFPKLDSNKFKIFMFHSAVKEFCPVLMESLPSDMLPDGFDYYAAGHLHEIIDEEYGGKRIVFPGPLFQTNFMELEKLSHTGFYIVSVDVDSKSFQGKDSYDKNSKSLHDSHDKLVKSALQISHDKINIKWQKLNICESLLITVDGNGKTASQIEREFLDMIDNEDVRGKIVLLKTSGKLKDGKPSDLSFKDISERCKSKGSLSMKRSIHLTSEDVEIKTEHKGLGVKEMELNLIEKVVAEKTKSKADSEINKELILKLIDALKEERREDEKNLVYDERIKAGIMKILGL